MYLEVRVPEEQSPLPVVVIDATVVIDGDWHPEDHSPSRGELEGPVHPQYRHHVLKKKGGFCSPHYGRSHGTVSSFHRVSHFRQGVALHLPTTAPESERRTIDDIEQCPWKSRPVSVDIPQELRQTYQFCNVPSIGTRRGIRACAPGTTPVRQRRKSAPNCNQQTKLTQQHNEAAIVYEWLARARSGTQKS